jgi:predicted dienelactone hydrolase/ABC-type amino acid transport substrate-binding protein
MLISSIKSLILAGITISFSFLTSSVKAAEKINFVYTPLTFSLSVESLETFAETGEITGDLKDYSSFFDDKTLDKIRAFLSKSYNFKQVNLYKIGQTSLAEDLLRQLGKVVSTHSERNGFYAIRGAVLTTAGKYDSWTIIDVFKEFPTSEIYVSLEALVQLKDELLIYENYREALEKSIIAQAKQQGETEPNYDFTQLSDLRNKGKYSFNKRTVNLQRNQYRQTQDGFVGEYSFAVDFYIPNNINKPAPVILISHGFGSVRQNYISLAEHLASYGFVVAIPEHIGSDLRYRQELLKGKLSSALSPVEYLDRPRDLSFIIDKLETLVKENPEWSKKLNLEQIGIIGDSLGGTTVLSLAGAPLNIPRLRQECREENVIVSTALILQCQAGNLPAIEYDLKDDRIKAVISAHPLSSAIFGPESIAEIDIPILITAGSDDIVTPVVTEQIHPFLWLQKEPKYLLFYEPGTHFSSSKPSAEYTANFIPEFIIGKNRNISSRYFQGIAVAFMQVYLHKNQDYLPYLSASYGQFMSKENEQLNISQIQQLTEENIINAYGNQLPIEITPEPIVAVNESNSKTSIIEEIKKTGVLKIGYPRQTEPFGYLDKNGDWDGFCAFYGDQLATYLHKQLNLAHKPKIIVLPSNLNNRFDLVAKGDIHLECGANTIVEDHNQVNFSFPFFVTGTYFLIPKANTNNFNPNQSLANSKIGVLANTSTASFLQQKYPQAEPVYFEGAEGIEQAIAAMENREINAVIDDGVLLQSKLDNNESLRDNYQIVPQLPLACDFYGLLLPKGDAQWNKLVNQFIKEKSLIDKYFSPQTSNKLEEFTNYCLNF